MRNLSWAKISRFFEHGDLVPFAVLISIWHFSVALISKGENVGVAIASGIFVDMLHFRTVRYAVNSRKSFAVFVAIITTAISYSFHLLFYAIDGVQIIDYLLAVPLPIGIPILAWQQATKVQEAANEEQELARQLQEENKGLQDKINTLQSKIKDQQDIIKAWRTIDKKHQALILYYAKQMPKETAMNILDVKDARTLESRVNKMNRILGK